MVRGRSGMSNWNFCYFLIRRVFWSLLVLFGLSIVIFVIARVMPGDPARMAMGPRASQEQVADLKAKMGLDKPLLDQYAQFVVGPLARRPRSFAFSPSGQSTMTSRRRSPRHSNWCLRRS